MKNYTTLACVLTGWLAVNSSAATDLEMVAAIGDLTMAPAMYTTDTGHTQASVSAGEVARVFIDGVDYQGNATRFFAYVGIPDGASSSSKVPAVVLVHGGGGTALQQYVNTWVGHGYATIMIATEGQTDDYATDEQIAAGQYVGKWYKHNAAGPARAGIYGDSDVYPITDQWMYQAVSCTVLANSLMRSLPEVDPDQVGVIGVSWGGIITSTVMGIDDRFAFAVPVYGSGHLYDIDNHYGKNLKDNELYQTVWDPMVRMDQVTMPTLWYSWPSDSIFPLDAQAKTYAASSAVRMVALKPGMGHGMTAGFNSDEPAAFANSVLSGTPWCVQKSLRTTGNDVAVTFTTTKPLSSASILTTPDSGFSGDRVWTETSIALVNNGNGTYTTSGTLPLGTTAWFINVKDSDGVISSSDYQDLVNPIDYNYAPVNSTLIEAESFDSQSGIVNEGTHVGYINHDDWIQFNGMNLSAGTYDVSFHYAAARDDSSISLETTDGTVLATVDLPTTGSWDTWSTVSASVPFDSVATDLVIKFKHPTANASRFLCNLDWFTLEFSGETSSTIVVFRKSNALGFAIDGNWDGANGQNVYLWSYRANNENQQWEEIDRGGGYYTYQKRGTSFSLDGGEGGSDGQNLYLWTTDPDNYNQQWKKVDLGNGSYQLQKRNATGYAIDGNWEGADGQNIYLWSAGGGNVNQQWTLEYK